MKSPSLSSTIDARLTQAAANAMGLRARLDALRHRHIAQPYDAAPLDRLAAMLSACAKAKPGSVEFAMEVAREAFLRRFGKVALPPSLSMPDTSLVLLGQSGLATAEAVVALASLLKGQKVDFVVADPGNDPQIRLLAAHVCNLVVIHADGAAAASNLASGATRAPMLALLRGAPECVTRWPAPGTAWIGVVGSRRLIQFGIRLPEAPVFDPHISLAMARSDWAIAQGLDLEMEDGGGLEFADLALKLDSAGVRVMSCGAGNGLFEEAVAPLDAARHWHRMAHFRARWGPQHSDAEAL